MSHVGSVTRKRRNPRTLLNLRKRMAKIRVFDPACGSGNFLVTAYKEMRNIEAEKVVRQSCGKANEVIVYCYGGSTAEVWWEKIKNSTTRFDNLQVINFSKKDTSELGKQASRLMKLQVNIQDGDVMVSVDDSIVYVTPVKWKNADH